MRLPIYRKLDERFRLLGLSMMELACLGGLFVLMTQVLSSFDYGLLTALLVCFSVYAGLIYLHKRFESHFALKWIRFATIPEGLRKKMINFKDAAPLRGSNEVD